MNADRTAPPSGAIFALYPAHHSRRDYRFEKSRIGSAMRALSISSSHRSDPPPSLVECARAKSRRTRENYFSDSDLLVAHGLAPRLRAWDCAVGAVAL